MDLMSMDYQLGGMCHYMFYTNATLARIKAVQEGEQYLHKEFKQKSNESFISRV